MGSQSPEGMRAGFKALKGAMGQVQAVNLSSSGLLRKPLVGEGIPIIESFTVGTGLRACPDA